MGQPSGTVETGEPLGPINRQFVERDRVLRGLGRVVAAARESLRRRRSAVYDATITDQDGATIAILRCHARTVGEQTFPEA